MENKIGHFMENYTWNYVHSNFHSGNVLLEYTKYNKEWYIGDLGLSQPANVTSSNDELHGIIPYIAPEIFLGENFTQVSDVFSLGMVMWELTTGCKPFDDVEHDRTLIDEINNGSRPEITQDTPKCFADLMNKCWDSDPSKRPLTTEIIEIIDDLFSEMNAEEFALSEKKRIELTQTMKLGPEFNKKPHPKAIFISRPLGSFIAKSSSTITYT
ncbi:843_t:CDS:2, partial [Funneliformis geosporum]